MIVKAPSFGKAHHFRKCDIVPAPALIGLTNGSLAWKLSFDHSAFFLV